jgi:hypothetical protein
VKFNTSTSNTVTLSVHAENGCGSSATASKTFNVNPNCKSEDDQVAEVTEIEYKVFEVYPNPANDRITIRYYSDGSKTFKLFVNDVLGKVIVSENVSSADGINEKEISLAHLNRGTYFVRLVSEEDEPKTLRLIVE